MKQKQLTTTIEEDKIDHMIWLINDLQQLLLIKSTQDDHLLESAISETVDQIKRVAIDMKTQVFIDKFTSTSRDASNINNVDVTIDDFNSLAICAFRYAFGRHVPPNETFGSNV